MDVAPDYSQFQRQDRAINPKRSELPKIFCPVLVCCQVEPLPGHEGMNLAVEVSNAEWTNALKKNLPWGNIVKDVQVFEEQNRLLIALSEKPAGVNDFSKKMDQIGISLSVHRVVETSVDDERTRLDRLGSLEATETNYDSMTLVVPQTWIIPDPDFTPKHRTISLYKGSAWMAMFKLFGDVVAAEIAFHGKDDVGMITSTGIAPAYRKNRTDQKMVEVCVNYKSLDSVKKAAVMLFERYLVHQKTKATQAACLGLANFAKFKKDASEEPKAMAPPPPVPQQMGQPMPAIHGAPLPPPPPISGALGAAPPPGGYQDISRTHIPIEEFHEVCARMERLERENQELMQLLVEMSQKRPEAPAAAADKGAPAEKGGDDSAAPWRKRKPNDDAPWRAKNKAQKRGSSDAPGSAIDLDGPAPIIELDEENAKNGERRVSIPQEPAEIVAYHRAILGVSH